MKNKIIILVVLVAVLLGAKAAGAVSVIVNGNQVDISALSSEQQAQMIDYVNRIDIAQKETKKLADVAKSETAVSAVKKAMSDPENISKWIDTIVLAVKKVCTELSVSANEFIKTPVGLIVVLSIIYNVGGSEIIEYFLDIVVTVPIWIVIMSCLFYMQRKYFSERVVYKNIVEEGHKIVKTSPYMVKYTWESDDAKTTMVTILTMAALLITIVALFVIIV